MAGDWIKMRTNLLTSPKVVRISSALKADRLRVTGGLFAVWCLFDAHSADGMLEGYTSETLDELIGFRGFADAMIAVDWLSETPEGLAIPRFDDHNGQSAKRRAQEADRKREARKESASNAYKVRTREEKRREEGNTSPDGEGGEPPKPTDPTEIIFGYGVPLLTSSGIPEKQARSFLGGLRKHHGDDAVVNQLRECLRAKPLQPLEWLAASLPPAGKRAAPGRHTGFDQIDYHAGVSADGSF